MPQKILIKRGQQANTPTLDTGELAFTIDKNNLYIGNNGKNISLTTTRDVTRFGAVGDGIADDTAAFEQALEEPGSIYVPEGHYRIANPLVLLSNQKLTGEGTLLFETFLRSAGGFLQADNVTGVEISGLTIKPYGASTGACLIEIKNAVDVCVKGVTIEGSGQVEGDGIRVRDSVNVKIEGNTVTGVTLEHYNNTEASGIRVTTCKDIVIEGNTVDNVLREGIGLSGGCENALIAGNFVTRTHLDWEQAEDGAIDCYEGEKNVVIRDNFISQIGSSTTGNKCSCIRVSAGENITIADNIIENSGYEWHIILITNRGAGAYWKNVNITGNIIRYQNDGRGSTGTYCIYVRYGQARGGFRFINNTIEGEGDPSVPLIYFHYGLINAEIAGNKVILPNMTGTRLLLFTTGSTQTEIDGQTVDIRYEDIKIVNNEFISPTRAFETIQGLIHKHISVIGNTFTGNGSVIRMYSSVECPFIGNIITGTDSAADVNNFVPGAHPSPVASYNVVITL